MQKNEWSVGLNQIFVVYISDDTGGEVDPITFYADIARDAQQYAEKGYRIVAMAAAPLRHSGAWIGREGSGYQTKISVTVVYAGP